MPLADCQQNQDPSVQRNELWVVVVVFFTEESWVKICQCAFEGHGKDRKAGASSEGGPQTNTLAGEWIKPEGLRVGLNCAALLKNTAETPLLSMFQMAQIGPSVC